MNSDIASRLDEGIARIRKNDIASAARCFEAVLESDPDHADACHLLAVTLINTATDLERARELLGRAMRLRPGEPVYVNSLGTCLWHRGRFAQAADAFEEAVRLRPDYVDAWFNLGNACMSAGEAARASAAYQRVVEINPAHLDALNGLGLALHRQGNIDEAISRFDLALELDPLRHDIHLNLANAHQSLRHFDTALLAIENSLALVPDNAKAYNNLGTLHDAREAHEPAAEAYRQSIALDSQSVSPHYNLGLVLHRMDRFEEAAACFDTVLELAGRWPPALINKANALYKLGRFDEAVAGFTEALEIDPGSEMAHLSLGHTWRRTGELERAVACYDRAIALRPDSAAAHFSKSLVLLKAGRYAAGWRHYEWRFEAKEGGLHKYPALDAPEWSGQDVGEGTVMVIGEQGLGDIVQFARYLPLVRERCARVVFAVAPTLRRLFASLDGVDEFVNRNQLLPIRGDYHVFLLSLPGIFGTTLESIPAPIPYLAVDEDEINRWRARRVAGVLNVGFAWTGNPDQAENVDRSCPLSCFLDLAGGLDGVVFHSLQLGEGAKALAALDALPHGIVDHTRQLSDYRDTAAYMKALDLVITVDTSVAHVAGAMGIPVWTVLWHAHCWRYLQRRTDSLWYPTMRLFRQRAGGEWGSVFEQVRDALVVLRDEGDESSRQPAVRRR